MPPTVGFTTDVVVLPKDEVGESDVAELPVRVSCRNGKLLNNEDVGSADSGSEILCTAAVTGSLTCTTADTVDSGATIGEAEGSAAAGIGGSGLAVFDVETRVGSGITDGAA